MSTSPERSLPVSTSKAIEVSTTTTAVRSLAAIVFTDTADFSSKMSRDEDGTLRRVARDLNFMKALCASYGGEVAKVTGDGLLLVFSSAVQAVGCAMEIQRDFREQHKSQPSSERLYHRIGIHLGDVFQQDGDVMGDGVNIAARLQTESEKGGVCLSGTVYDIVQNRVPFVVTRCRTRKLKNVGSVVTYQAFPPSAGSPYFQVFLSWIRARRRLLIIGAILVAVYFLSRSGHVATKTHTDNFVREIGPLGPSIEADEGEDSDQKTASSPAPGTQSASLTEFYLARYAHLQHYDFVGMQDWLKANDNPEVPRKKMIEACVLMEDLDAWCGHQLKAYNSGSPLNVHGGEVDGEEKENAPVELDAQDFQAWEVPTGIAIKTNGHVLTLPQEQVPPLLWARIAATLLRQNAQPGDPVTKQLEKGLTDFRAAYHILD